MIKPPELGVRGLDRARHNLCWQFNDNFVVIFKTRNGHAIAQRLIIFLIQRVHGLALAVVLKFAALLNEMTHLLGRLFDFVADVADFLADRFSRLI